MLVMVKVSDVMDAYLPYVTSHDKFAEALNESLSKESEISRVAVTNWCNSKSVPQTDFLWSCAVAYEDWRRSWAMDCLKVKLPELFENAVIVFRQMTK